MMPLEADDIASIDGASICGPMLGRPLVALLDGRDCSGRDCSVAMPIMLYLRGISARDLNHIVVQDDRNAAEHLTDDGIKAINALSEDERIGERIIASVAPSIYGHDDIKRALVLALFGGQPNNNANSWSGRHT